MSVRVMIVEDDPFTRISLVAAIRHFGYDVVVEEASPGLAVTKARTTNPQVAVLDLHLGTGATGLDVAQELRKTNPRIGLVLLTSYEDPRLLNPSLPPVPKGTVYLTKQSVTNMTDLRAAIESSLDLVSRELPGIQAPAFGNLTDVQIETLRLVAQGLSNSEIASRRFVNEKSIEQTVARVAKALDIKSEPSINQRVHIARVYFRAIGVKADV